MITSGILVIPLQGDCAPFSNTLDWHRMDREGCDKNYGREYAVEGLADSALHAVQALLPGCSVAAGINLNGNRSIRTLGAIGPQGPMLLEGQALMAAYKAMRERATQITPLDAEAPGTVI